MSRQILRLKRLIIFRCDTECTWTAILSLASNTGGGKPPEGGRRSRLGFLSMTSGCASFSSLFSHGDGSADSELPTLWLSSSAEASTGASNRDLSPVSQFLWAGGLRLLALLFPRRPLLVEIRRCLCLLLPDSSQVLNSSASSREEVGRSATFDHRGPGGQMGQGPEG